MGLFDWFKKKQPKDEFTELLVESMVSSLEGAVDADELPNGQGEFGLDRRNPIPTSFFEGDQYLRRLRTAEGRPVKAHRFGSTLTPGIEGAIDIYELSDETGKSLGRIYICPYHKRISGKAPKGFKLV